MDPDRRDSDVALWARACEHDGDAFGKIYDRHSARVFSHCYRRVGSVAAAEDLVSMTFMEAWRRRRSVQFSSADPDGTESAEAGSESTQFRIAGSASSQPGRGSESQSVLPWLLATANNLILNHRRSAFRYQRFLNRLPPAEAEVPASEIVLAELDRVELGEAVNKVLAALSEQDRLVLRLCDIEETPFKEAAEYLHIPVSTLKSRLYRARDKARKQLVYLQNLNG